MLLPSLVLLFICLLCSVAWYSCLLDQAANTDKSLGPAFVASYVLWVLLVLGCYLLVALWCMFLDAARSRPDGGSMAKLLPWGPRSLAVGFGAGFVMFVLFALLARGALLRRAGAALRRGAVPGASVRDDVTVNYTKGVALALPAVVVPVTLFATGGRS